MGSQPGDDLGRERVRLQAEAAELRRRLCETEETLRAIREGEVDAIVVRSDQADGRVFTLETADRPYRLLVERMPQGALTLTAEGVILYSNQPFADL